MNVDDFEFGYDDSKGCCILTFNGFNLNENEYGTRKGSILENIESVVYQEFLRQSTIKEINKKVFNFIRDGLNVYIDNNIDDYINEEYGDLFYYRNSDKPEFKIKNEFDSDDFSRPNKIIIEKKKTDPDELQPPTLIIHLFDNVYPCGKEKTLSLKIEQKDGVSDIQYSIDVTHMMAEFNDIEPDGKIIKSDGIDLTLFLLCGRLRLMIKNFVEQYRDREKKDGTENSEVQSKNA